MKEDSRTGNYVLSLKNRREGVARISIPRRGLHGTRRTFLKLGVMTADHRYFWMKASMIEEVSAKGV